MTLLEAVAEAESTGRGFRRRGQVYSVLVLFYDKTIDQYVHGMGSKPLDESLESFTWSVQWDPKPDDLRADDYETVELPGTWWRTRPNCWRPK